MNPLWRNLLYCFPVVILITLLPLYFLQRKRDDSKQSLIVKGMCGVVPIIFCLNGCLVNGFIAFWWMLLGLIVYMIGSILIEKQLLAGTATLAAGHILFIIAYLFMAPPRFLCIPVLLILIFAFLISFRKVFKKMGKRAVFFVLYIIALILMVSLSLTLPYSTGTAFMTIGSLFVAISHLFLAHREITENAKTTDTGAIICSVLYYIGLYFFALSVWM